MADDPPYNPLDKRQLGRSVANELLTRPLVPLATLPPFRGAGIYALYYSGPLAAYANWHGDTRPIYVGKAVPKGARKGLVGLDVPAGRVLYNRLRHHATSIRRGHGLKIEEFSCRYLIVDDIWIPLGETLLITEFQPPWNHPLDGFGNNVPGKGRYEGVRSAWDTVHPGRIWAPYSPAHPDAARLIEQWRPGDAVPIPDRIKPPKKGLPPELLTDEEGEPEPMVAESPLDDDDEVDENGEDSPDEDDSK